MNNKLLVIRMDKAIHDSFKAKCAASGVTMTEIVMLWIENYSQPESKAVAAKKKRGKK